MEVCMHKSMTQLNEKISSWVVKVGSFNDLCEQKLRIKIDRNWVLLIDCGQN